MEDQDIRNNPAPVEPVALPDSELDTVTGGVQKGTKETITNCWCND